RPARRLAARLAPGVRARSAARGGDRLEEGARCTRGDDTGNRSRSRADGGYPVTLAGLLIFAAKAFFIVMFAMNVAVILTWVDRRQGAVMQDRVGPNRAVIWLPTVVAQALALLPALAVAGGVILLATTSSPAVPDKTTRAILFSHLAILVTWLTGLV